MAQGGNKDTGAVEGHSGLSRAAGGIWLAVFGSLLCPAAYGAHDPTARSSCKVALAELAAATHQAQQAQGQATEVMSRDTCEYLALVTREPTMLCATEAQRRNAESMRQLRPAYQRVQAHCATPTPSVTKPAK